MRSQAIATEIVVNVNEAPILDNQSFSVAHLAANGILVGTVLALDRDLGQTKTFSIVSGNALGAFILNPTSGAITVAKSSVLLYQTNPLFDLLVSVTDNGAGKLKDEAKVTIQVMPASNQPPEISNQTFSVDEHSAEGTIAGKVLATDPNAGQLLSYSILSGNTNKAFAIHASTGNLTIADSAAVDYHKLTPYVLTVKVQDNGTGNLSDQATIQVKLNISTTAIEDISTSTAMGMSVYPNPVSNGILNVRLENVLHERFELTILDLTGKVLLKKQYEQENSLSLALADYPPALYIIQIRAASFRFSTKFVVR